MEGAKKKNVEILLPSDYVPRGCEAAPRRPRVQRVPFHQGCTNFPTIEPIHSAQRVVSWALTWVEMKDENSYTSKADRARLTYAMVASRLELASRGPRR